MQPFRTSSKELIKLVSNHNVLEIYMRDTKGGGAPAAGEDAQRGGSIIVHLKNRTIVFKKNTYLNKSFYYVWL